MQLVATADIVVQMADEIAPLDIQNRVRALINRIGAQETGQRLTIGRESALRIAGGFTVRTNTLVVAKQRLPEAEKDSLT